MNDVLNRFHVWRKTGSRPEGPLARDPGSMELPEPIAAARPDTLLAEVYVLADRLLTSTRLRELHELFQEFAAWQVTARTATPPPTSWAPR